MRATGIRKTWLYAFCLAMVVAGLFFIPLREEGASTGQDGQRVSEISYSLAQNTLIGRSDGQKSWELSVQRFTMDKDERMVHLSGEISGVIYKDGEIRYTLQAGGGLYDKRTQDLELAEGVQITSTDGERIIAQGLNYQHQQELITLKPPVELTAGKYRLSADQVQILQDPERVVARGNVLIIGETNEEIRGSEVIYYRDKDNWQIIGPVELTALLGEE